jgi:small subunit ribosomal protein S20
MPNLANAKKALRQSAKRAKRNDILKGEIRSLRRSFRKLLQAKKFDDASKMIPTLDKKLDKMITKGVFPKNRVARLKSRISLALNRAKAEK